MTTMIGEATRSYIPHEIQDKIFDYHAGLVHRESYKETIPLLNLVGAISYVQWNLVPHDTPNAVKEECKRAFKIIIECKCCERHQERRPTLKQLEGGFIPEYPSSVLNDHPCKCPCRHLSRWICREVNDSDWTSIASIDMSDDLSNVSTLLDMDIDMDVWNEEVESIS